MTESRRRLAPEQRRAQLLDIGARLFADRPYDEVWIEEVAELAGVSRGLMYHYFPNKRDFFAAIVQRAADGLVEATTPDPALPVLEQVVAGLDAYLDHFAANGHGIRAVNQGALSADAGIRAIVEREIDAQQRRILDAIDLDPSEVEVAAMAVHGWLAFVRATCLDWLDHPAVPAEALRELCLRTLAGALAPYVDLGIEQGSQAPAIRG
ncbi:TetR/AcrR family transcriptional regulator [Rhodococcus spelaei]|uniref:TetR/AcrR family transcriptional regulator n=1 Tax=Rhodococcus spelaei TaxID=2546320 RepID=A0A541BS66_9NOCA|nr:TetR/AcrR family transcriptional regulator [Rhodococcus spelaei]TQF75135.1 TetR/AcrR family transcriptional regulator [Rhodococcus spelaei]